MGGRAEGGNRRHKRARNLRLSPRDVPRWDCLLRFKFNDRQELVRRRWFVGACRGCWSLQWNSISDTKLCGVPGQKSVFVALVGQRYKNFLLKVHKSMLYTPREAFPRISITFPD
ncbi:unnamed protein product [Ixodes pacificus]